MKTMKIVSLASGGIDSSVLLFMLQKEKHEVLPLYINYGHKASKMELNSFHKICKFLHLAGEVIDAEGINKIKSGLTTREIPESEYPFFPARNLLLFTIGAAYAFSRSSRIVSMGFLRNPEFPDQTSDFITSAEKTVELATGIAIKLFTPFIKLDKNEVVQLAKKYRFPLELTYSCYSGEQTPCGKCKACLNRETVMAGFK
jgi:7-cyano-7-deazaguanine synthase